MIPECVSVAITMKNPDEVYFMTFITRSNVAGGGREVAATKENIDAEIARQLYANRVASWRLIAFDDIPTDRTYRSAMRDDGAQIVHDMPHARDIHRDRLREMRAPLLAELDIAYQRADEDGDAAEKTRIAALKRSLRDVTDDPAIEAAMTPEALLLVTPEALRSTRI